MADLETIEDKVDSIQQMLFKIQVDATNIRHEDKEQLTGLLHEIKQEICLVRDEAAQVMGVLIEKIDKNYVRKDVNDEKDKAHDSKILELSTGLSGAKTEHVVLKNRIDRFAVAGASIATVLAMFKNDLADLIKHILP